MGAVICSDGEVAGTEFKSLVYVCRDDASGDKLRYVDVISRCVVNLVFVQIKAGEKNTD